MSRALLLLLVLAIPSTARGVTVRDIVELSKAGVSDSILIALIDADRTVFWLDRAQILDLLGAKVSEAVILKMLATREAETAAAAAAAEPPPTGAKPAVTAEEPQMPPWSSAPAQPPPLVQRSIVVVPFFGGSFGWPWVPERPRRSHTHPEPCGDVVVAGGGINTGLPIRNGEFVRPSAPARGDSLGTRNCR